MFFLISHKIDDFDEGVVPFLHFFLKFLKGIGFRGMIRVYVEYFQGKYQDLNI